MTHEDTTRMRDAIVTYVQSMVHLPPESGEMNPIVVTAIETGILDVQKQIEESLIRSWYRSLLAPTPSDEVRM